MSTLFQQPNNGEIIDAQHINQFVPPVHDLEIGAAHFRPATTSGSDYVVDFQQSTNPDGHFLASLSQGQIIVFKADADSSAGAELQVTLEGGGSAVHPIYQSSNPVEAGDIKADQIVMVIFNNTSTPRFDVVGATSAGGGGGGANSLDELTDVAVSSPQSQDILQHDGSGNFVNRTPAAAGLVEQSRQIGTSAPLTGGGSLSTDLTLGIPQATGSTDGYLAGADFADFAAKQDALTGTSDVPGLDTALAGKAETDHTHDASDIVSGALPVVRGGTGADTAAAARTSLDVPSTTELSTALSAKQDTSEKGQANGYASLDAGGKVPSSQLPTSSGGGASTLDDLSDVVITGTPSTGSILQHDGTAFVNTTAADARTAFGLSVATGQVAYGGTDGLTSSPNFVYGTNGLGIGAATPARPLHVNDSSNPQQRWSYSDTEYSDLQVSDGGNIELSLTGNKIAIGGTCSGVNSVALGKSSEASGANVAIGALASAMSPGSGCTSIGIASQSSYGGTALGAASNACNLNLAIGYGAQSTISHSCTMGSQQLRVDSIYGGKGECHATPTAWGLKGTSGYGTDIAGGDLLLDSGAGTGSASSGFGRLRATASGSSGDTMQGTYSDLLTWKYGALSFYGATPVSQQTLLAPLADNSGGSPGTTMSSAPSTSVGDLAGHVDDMVASLVARITSLESKLVATTLVTQAS